MTKTEQDTKAVIYGLVDPRTHEVRYIGKAINPERRLRQHLEPSQLLRYKSHKNSWLKNLLSEGHLPRLLELEQVDVNEANEAESKWIALYRSQGFKLTNGTNGGDGGAVTDPLALERIRGAHKGSKRTEATRKQMSESAKKRCSDPKEVERLRSISNGQPPARKGETNNQARLTEGQVREMRRLHREGVTGVALARQFQVTPANVSLIVRGLAWAHLTDEKGA